MKSKIRENPKKSGKIRKNQKQKSKIYVANLGTIFRNHGTREKRL